MKSFKEIMAESEEYVAEGRVVIKTTASSMDDNDKHIIKLKNAGIDANQGAGGSHHIIVQDRDQDKAKKLLAGHLKEEVDSIDEQDIQEGDYYDKWKAGSDARHKKSSDMYNIVQQRAKDRANQMSRHSHDSRERAHQRHQDKLDAIHTSGNHLYSAAEREHQSQQRMARDAHDTQRRKDDDADTRRTFNVMRNRLKNKKQNEEVDQMDEKISVVHGKPPRDQGKFTPHDQQHTHITPTGGRIHAGIVYTGKDKPEVKPASAPTKPVKKPSPLDAIRARMNSVKEEADLSEGIKQGDFVKDPQGKVHRVFAVKGNVLHTGEYRGNNGYGGDSMLHKTKATKIPTPKDVTEEVMTEKSDQINELSQDTLKSYAMKVADDAMKHPMNPTKRPAEKRNNSVTGFSKALNRLPPEKFFNKEENEQVDEGSKNLPGKATHQTNKDLFSHRHEMIIPGSTTLSHLGGNEYKIHSGPAKGKKINLDKLHVNKLSEETQGESVNTMSRYVAAIASEVSYTNLEEKTLTPAELKKREEVAKAIERENPGMDKSKKMAIATATAKKVAEETEQIDELSKSTLASYVGKAAGSAAMTAHAAGSVSQQYAGQPISKRPDDYDKSRKDTVKRLKNINKAVDKMTKEDMHYCAKHIYSERFGEGLVVEGSHAEPDEQGLIEWYDVDFGGQVRRVMTEKVKVMHAEYHMNHKKKKMSEEDEPTHPKTAKEKSLAKLAPPHDKITHADVMVGRGVKKEEVEQADEAASWNPIKHIPKDKQNDAVKTAAKDVKRSSYADRAALLRAGGVKQEDTQVNANNRIVPVESTKSKKELGEAMISYSDFNDKLAMHRKAGNKIIDDKYDDKKASYTVIDKEGVGKKITHTDAGVKQQHLGNMKGDDAEAAETKPAEKRGRGRPAGSTSGARRHN